MSQEQQLCSPETHGSLVIEDLYRLIVEAAREGIWVMDANRITSYVNPRMAKMLGRTPEEMTGQRVTEFMFPEDLPAFKARMAVRVQGLGGKYEQRFLHADGTPVWCIVSATALLDDSGRFGGSFALLTDITRQRRAEQSLRESESNLRAFLEAIPSPAFILDDSGRVVVGNASCARLLGRSLDQLPGLNLMEMLPPPQVAALHRELINRVMEDQQPRTFEHHQGGQAFRNYVLPIANQEGACRRIAIIQMDISEAKRVEMRLRRNETRLDSLVRLNQISGRPIQEIMDFGLEEAIHLTESEVGYIYFYSEARKQFTLYSWSNSVMEQCTIVEKQTVYELDKTGIWGEAVRQRKTILVNEFQKSNPLKKGYPEGHVQLQRYLTLPIFDGSEIVAVVGVGNKAKEYTQEDIEQLQLFMDGLWNITQRKRIEEQLIYQSTHDVLTGLYNRSHFESILASLQTDRRQFPVSVVMVDVNGLKTTNDLHGHAAGDQLLQDTAQVLGDVFRREDTIARIGGDEFAILLPQTGVETVANVVERLQRSLRAHNRRTTTCPLSLSVGAATGAEGSDLAALLRTADDRMYQEKFLYKVSQMAPEPGLSEPAIKE